MPQNFRIGEIWTVGHDLCEDEAGCLRDTVCECCVLTTWHETLDLHHASIQCHQQDSIYEVYWLLVMTMRLASAAHHPNRQFRQAFNAPIKRLFEITNVRSPIHRASSGKWSQVLEDTNKSDAVR
jgi:hypothetical protein